ncbi:hypothetical protein ABEW05_002123 [Botrytis cinerea]
MGSIHVRGDVRNQEEKAREIEWERNKLYIHLAARNNPGTFHWSLYLTEERPEVGWVYHVFDPEPDRWILEMAGGDEEGEGEEEKEKENIDAGGGEDISGGSESPGEESGGDGEQPLVDPEEGSTESQEEQTASKKTEEKRKREARDTGHSSDESSDETAPWESATSLHDQEDDRRHKKTKTVHWKDQEPNATSNDLEDAPPGNPHAASIDENHAHAPPSSSSSSSSLLAAVEIGTDVQDMRTIIEQTIATEWETGRKKIAKGDKICREFLLKCVEELESLGVLSFKYGKGVEDVEREAEEFGLLSDPALNKGARKGRVWKSRVVE